jgi:hypothetical protein
MTWMEKIKEGTTFLKDILTILGIPALIWIGKDLYDLQNKALESQNKSLEAHNSFLKETQYDRALTIIKSQKELYEMNMKELDRKIADKDTEITEKDELLKQKEIEKERSRKTAAAYKELFEAGTQYGFFFNPDAPITTKKGWFEKLGTEFPK